MLSTSRQSFENSSRDAVSVIWEMVRHNLGVSESVRCIVAGDGENEVFVKDTVETLKHLDLEHPAAVHVMSTCLAHKDVYGVGGKSLLFFIGQLTTQLHRLLKQGIPLPYVEELLHEGVDYCIDHLQRVTVPVCLSSTRDHAVLSHKPCSPVTSPLQAFHTSCVINDGAAKSQSPPLSVEGAGQVLGSGHSSVGVKVSGVGTDSGTGSGHSSVGANLSGLGTGAGLSHTRLNDGGNRTRTETCKPSRTQFSHKSHIVHNSANIASSLTLSSLNSFLQGHTKSTSSSANQRKNVVLRSRHLAHDDPVSGQTDCRLSESGDGGQSSLTNVSGGQSSVTTVSGGQTSVTKGSVSSDQYSLTNVGGGQSSVSTVSSSQSPVTNGFVSGDQSSVTAVSGDQPSVTKKDGDDRRRTGDSSRVPGLSVCTAGSAQHLASTHENYDQSALFLPTTKNGLKCGQKIAAEKSSITLPRDAQSLSHGCPEMMSWAEQAMTRQLLQGKDLQFDAGLVHTVCVGGGSGRHQLVEGLVISASQDVLEVMCGSSGHTSLLLINGDVTSRFRHVGFRDTLLSTRLTGTTQRKTHDTWPCQVLTLLTQLSVGVVLARGSVDADLSACCLSAGIAVVDRVPLTALKLLQAACRTQLLTYILHANQENLCQGVALKTLREDWCDTVDPGRKHLVITPPVLVQTMVISSPSAVGREVQEEEFSHCLDRLKQAAQDGRLLAGGAVTEAWCASLLTLHHHHPHTDTASQRGRWAGEVALYRSVVRAALAEAFLSFSHAVQRNRQRAGHSHSVQGNCTVQHNRSSPVKAYGPCHHCSQHATGLHSIQSALAETCQKCAGASMGVFVHESLNRNKNSHSIPLSENHGCRNELDTQDGHLTSQPVTHGVDEDSGLRATRCAGNSRQCPQPCDLRSCAPRGRAAEEGLCKLAPLRQSVPEASATDHGSADVAVWDNYCSKVNGWRSAVQCACAVMRMDEAIVTGYDQNSVPPQAVLL